MKEQSHISVEFSLCWRDFGQELVDHGLGRLELQESVYEG